MRQTLDALLDGKASWSDTIQVDTHTTTGFIPTVSMVYCRNWSDGKLCYLTRISTNS